MKVAGINNKVSFERRPKKSEEQGLSQTIKEAYKVMGTENRVVITHGSCFPAIEYDSFIGSPYGNDAKEYLKFLMLYGFNANQLGPGGELVADNTTVYSSPYSSSAFAQNRFFIDLKKLTKDEYANILSEKTFKNLTIIPKPSVKDYSQTDFNEARAIYDEALFESYKNFKIMLSKGKPEAIKLNKEFEQFSVKHNSRLINEGIFKVLSEYYGTDDFEKWDSELDKDLIRKTKNGNIDAIERYSNILKYSKNKIEQYKFEQFLLAKQIKENQQWRQENNFKYFSDLLVGCSKMDYWRCRDAFLDGYQLGVPQGDDRNPQIWHLPVLNPRKLFTADGLGSAGQFLKDKLEYALEYNENIRIDHAMGLIEPYIIDNSTLVLDEYGNPTNNPHKNPVVGKYMSKMRTDSGEILDDYRNYSCDYLHKDGSVTYHSNVMNKIVIPVLKEHGINPKDAVWEDVCSQPQAFVGVFYDDLKLPGLTQTEWSRVEDSPVRNWFMVGSHDSIPAHQMIKRDWTKNNDAWNPLYLAGYLHQDNFRAEERDNFCKKIAHNDEELVKAKFAELFTTKNFQITFSDLLGITDTVYNQAGTRNSTNWKERIPSNFLDKYYENLSSDNPTAINVPEVLKIALQAKIDMQIAKSSDKTETRKILNNKYKSLLDDLETYSQILKEK